LNCSKNIQKLQHLGSSPSNHYWDYLLVQNHVEPTLNIININGETFQRSCQVHFLHDSNCGLGSLSMDNIALILMLMKQVWNTVARQYHRQLAVISFCFPIIILFCVARPCALQDFTVLPTEQFRRSVIRSSSVIFLPTSSPTEYVRRLYLRRWFPIPSVYPSEKQKNTYRRFYRRNVRAKKKIPAWNIPTDFHSVGDVKITDGK